MAMPRNLPIKVIDLKYKQSSADSDYFGAFQLILSNGTSSPVFTAKGETDQDLKSMNINDFSSIKSIKGTKV